MRHWNALDWVVASYTTVVALLIAIRFASVPEWPWLIFLHSSVLAVLVWLPPRGARWERSPEGAPSRHQRIRGAGRYLRYNWQMFLIIFYFEEVRFTINAIAPDQPYWFEPYLYEADRVIFGELPARTLAGWANAPLDELMHALYFAYYPIVVGGLVIAWLGGSKHERVRPGPGFDPATTSIMTAYVLSDIWYPWLPARGPWVNEALVAGRPSFEGFLFTPFVQWIIERGGVRGTCFPSSHVAGVWGLVLGMRVQHPKAAWILGSIGFGMSLSCVYTRYHHGVDIFAGFLMGTLGAWLGRRWTRQPQ